MEITRSGAAPSGTGPAEWFKGVDPPLGLNEWADVTFEPAEPRSCKAAGWLEPIADEAYRA